MGLKKIFGQKPAVLEGEAGSSSNDTNFVAMFSLLVFWSITSIIAFSVAGERMPWLTYHMAWPMVLLTGWGIGQIIESLVEQAQGEKVGQTALAIFVSAVFALAVFNTIRALFGTTPPFQGFQLEQLQATSAFLLPLITAILTGAFIAYLMRNDYTSISIVALVVLGVVTLGASIINGATLLSLT